MSVFIYRPKSGSRVFSENPNRHIRVTTWGNGCKHVEGGVHLSWNAAAQGNNWRQEGRVLMDRIVMAVGGVAWDEQGTLSIVVPTSKAYKAWELISCLDADRTRRTQNVVNLIVAGCVDFTPGDIWDIVPVYVHDIDVSGPLPRYRDWQPVSVEGGCDPLPDWAVDLVRQAVEKNACNAEKLSQIDSLGELFEIAKNNNGWVITNLTMPTVEIPPEWRALWG